MDASVIGWFAQVGTVGGVLAIYHYIDGRNRATSKEVEALRRDHDTRLTSVERSLDRLGEKLDHLPRGTEVAALSLQVAKLEGAVNGSLSGVRAQMQSIHSRVERIDDFLEREHG